MNAKLLDPLDDLANKLSAAIDTARDALEEVNPLHQAGITDDLVSRVPSIRAAIDAVPESTRKDPAWRQDFESLDTILKALQDG